MRIGKGTQHMWINDKDTCIVLTLNTIAAQQEGGEIESGRRRSLTEPQEGIREQTWQQPSHSSRMQAES